jgi:transposase
MVTAAIDVHKQVLQAVVLDAESGEVVEERLAGREQLIAWAGGCRGRVEAVAIEATTGWRWVARELQAAGLEVRLVDPGQAKALQGRKRRAKTDRLDARWLALLLAKEMLPQAWLPPAEIQYLRDRTRLRKALADDRRRWTQRLHALLTQEGWPCQRARLLTRAGRRWAASLALAEPARAQVELYLRLLVMLESELEPLEQELTRFARSDRRCQALETIFGVGPILACHLLAEIGAASRFRRARQITRLAGLDPVVEESADSRRRGKLAKQGPPTLRWALVQAALHAPRRTSPDRGLYASASRRCGSQRARLTVARKIGRRAYHVLRELEQQEQAA